MEVEIAVNAKVCFRARTAFVRSVVLARFLCDLTTRIWPQQLLRSVWKEP